MKPMMAQPIDISAVDKVDGYRMEPKLDGMRLLLHVPGGNLHRALTRSGRDVVAMLPRLWVEEAKEYFQHFYLMTGFEWLDCEFGYRTSSGHPFILDFNKTMRVMGSQAAEAQRKAAELDDLPSATVFDIPDAGELPLWRRRGELERLIYADAEDSPDWLLGQVVSVVAQAETFNNTMYTYWVQAGGEGAMLKNPDSLYEPGGRRAKTWYKLKKFATVDMYVVGADPGQGKYEGLIGALVVQTADGMQVRVSGMSDDQRLYMSARLDRLVREKRVVEVKYFGLTAGTPRHPQFLRWRPDRTWESCLWKEQAPEPSA